MAFPAELRAAFPSWGPDWDGAVEAGVDVSLLEENLAATPLERLERLQAQVDATQALRRAAGLSAEEDDDPIR